MLKACIDTNISLSGVIFSGKPADIVTAAFNRKFHVVSSRIILDEVERHLLGKFRFSPRNTRRFIGSILQIVDLYEPTGFVKAIRGNHADNLVLETAILGRARYLVTGDNEHLVPLRTYRNVRVVNPAQFFMVLGK